MSTFTKKIYFSNVLFLFLIIYFHLNNKILKNYKADAPSTLIIYVNCDAIINNNRCILFLHLGYILYIRCVTMFLEDLAIFLDFNFGQINVYNLYNMHVTRMSYNKQFKLLEHFNMLTNKNASRFLNSFKKLK